MQRFGKLLTDGRALCELVRSRQRWSSYTRRQRASGKRAIASGTMRIGLCIQLASTVSWKLFIVRRKNLPVSVLFFPCRFPRILFDVLWLLSRHCPVLLSLPTMTTKTTMMTIAVNKPDRLFLALRLLLLPLLLTATTMTNATTRLEC